MQKGFSTILVLIIVLVISALGGAYYLGQQSLNTIQPAQLVNIPSPTPDVTVNWKTYTNSTYSFSVGYPSNWTTSERSNVPNELFDLTITADPKLNTPGGGGPETGMHVIISNNAKNESLTNYVNKEIVEPDVSYMKGFDKTFTDKSLQVENITIDNIPAIKVTGLSGAGNPGPSIFIVSGKNIFDLSWEKTNQPNDDQLYNEILSTFKVTDQTSTADTSSWKTYTNSDVKFSIQYPNTWTLTEGKAPAGYNPTQFPGGIMRVDLKGTQGNIDILWGGGFGGGPCPQTHYQVQTNTGLMDFCDSTNSDNSELLNTSNDGSANGTSQNTRTNTLTTFAISSEINSPYQTNRTEIIQILSTFKFTN